MWLLTLLALPFIALVVLGGRSIRQTRASSTRFRMHRELWRQELISLGQAPQQLSLARASAPPGLWFSVDQGGFLIVGSAIMAVPTQIDLSMEHGVLLPAELLIAGPDTTLPRPRRPRRIPGALGKRVLVCGAHPDQVTGLLAAAGLKTILYRFLRLCPGGAITGREISIVQRGFPAERLSVILEEMRDVARALQEARLAPLLALQETLGLSGGQTDDQRWRFRGQHGGIGVAIELSPDELMVRASITARLPAGFRLRLASGLDSTVLDNPILSRMLEVSGGTPANHLLADPALTAPIMGVLHAWPGSRVDPLAVVLIRPGWTLSDLPEAITAAAELAAALNTAAAHTRLQP